MDLSQAQRGSGYRGQGGNHTPTPAILRPHASLEEKIAYLRDEEDRDFPPDYWPGQPAYEMLPADLRRFLSGNRAMMVERPEEVQRKINEEAQNYLTAGGNRAFKYGFASLRDVALAVTSAYDAERARYKGQLSSVAIARLHELDEGERWEKRATLVNLSAVSRKAAQDTWRPFHAGLPAGPLILRQYTGGRGNPKFEKRIDVAEARAFAESLVNGPERERLAAPRAARGKAKYAVPAPLLEAVAAHFGVSTRYARDVLRRSRFPVPTDLLMGRGR
jgi:hypothetical protein